MPCMGPIKDTNTPHRITEYLREHRPSDDHPNPQYRGFVSYLEKAICHGLGITWVTDYQRYYVRSGRDDAAAQAYLDRYATIQNYLLILLGMLHGLDLEQVDWEVFGSRLEEIVWEWDCENF